MKPGMVKVRSSFFLALLSSIWTGVSRAKGGIVVGFEIDRLADYGADGPASPGGRVDATPGAPPGCPVEVVEGDAPPVEAGLIYPFHGGPENDPFILLDIGDLTELHIVREPRPRLVGPVQKGKDGIAGAWKDDEHRGGKRDGEQRYPKHRAFIAAPCCFEVPFLILR
jgi:hypothetical protein